MKSLPGPWLQGFQFSVVIAVAVAGVVQMAVDQVVHVVTVRDLLVAAPVSVDVAGIMRPTGVPGGAAARMGGGNFQVVLIDVIAVGEMEVAVVEVIDVVAVLYRRVAAAGAVDMIVGGVGGVVMGHGRVPVDGGAL